MKRWIALLAAGTLVVLAWMAVRLAVRPGDVPVPVAAVDFERAAIDLTLERTLRESRAGIEVPAVEAPPVAGSQEPDAVPLQAGSTDPGTIMVGLPEGYSLGAYRGPMKRAPLTGAAGADPSPNPPWLGAAAAPDAILEQAARSGRPFTFAVLRVLPGTNLQALDRALAALGSRIEGSTGEYVRLRVPLDRARLETIARLDGVLGIGAVPPGLKAGEAFVQELLSRPAGAQVPVYITLMASDPAGEWRQALSELGVTAGAYDPALRSYTANLPAAALAPVLQADFVLSVEPVPVVTANHESSVPVMGVDAFRQYDPFAERFSGLTGEGIAVGVLDTGLNTGHMDIANDRASICGANLVTDQTWDLWLDLHGHGTHVFGTIAGAGRASPGLAGIAPGLSHLRFGKVLAAEGYGSDDNIRRGMDYLSRPTGCAWQGTPSEAVKPLIVNMSLAAVSLGFSGRGVGERKLDSVVRAHSQLYVVAQANLGLHGFSNYATAKNSLAVGAVDDAGIIAGFSSHGPTADGRLAPNVVGTGVNLTSARGGASVSGHQTFSGTSMAAPSVAGVAALLMQARPEFRNRPALARARLMASAVRPHAYLESRAQLPADNTDGPGGFQNLYGLGLVSLRTSVYSLDDPHGWLIGSVSSEPENGSYEYIDIEVPEGAGRLDVVLTWDEQPADTLTRSVLGNLDLWADPGADCGAEACGEYASRSEVDNVEWLLIEDPSPGTWRIKVAPVEIYGESSAAAVAWKILRAKPTPALAVSLEDTSPGADSEYITIDVTVDADRYVASGTTLHLGCANREQCVELRRAFLPDRSPIHREDGLNWSEPYSTRVRPIRPVSIGEVAAGSPRRVQLSFLRDSVPPDSAIHVTASAWNAESASQSLAVGAGAGDTDREFLSPANDSFAASERIAGPAGETSLDLALASREPGETLVGADSRTLWYEWRAPEKGLFRFRLQEADTNDPVDADFALFTGGRLVDLELTARKEGREISFAAQAGAVYRLRIASDRWALRPSILKWESADTRPANDDFAYPQAIEGESGSIAAANEGATLESSEFLGGRAATVWFSWTAPGDGWWSFSLAGDSGLAVNVFAGARVDELRLVSQPYGQRQAIFTARAGETYRIAVAAPSAEDSGAAFTLSWEPWNRESYARSVNDLFESAMEIGGPDGIVHHPLRSGDSQISLTVEPGEPTATGIGTRWWKWTAPSDGPYTFRMGGSSAFRLTFFTGNALDDLQPVGSLAGDSTLVLEAADRTVYWIALGLAADSIGYRRDGLDSFSWGPTPANDDRAAASLLAGASGTVQARLAHATSAPNEPADTVGRDSVWWQWRAPTDGWQRFRVQGDPLSTVLAVYSDATSAKAIADSERTFLANGRVEVRWLASAGQRYEVRLSIRPGTDRAHAATLGWEAAEAPAYLAYRGAVTLESLADNPVSQGFRWPRNLAMSEDGNHLFSTSDRGIFAFERDTGTGDIELAYRAQLEQPAEVESFVDAARYAHLWWNARDDRLVALTWTDSHSFALPENGSSILSHEAIDLRQPTFQDRTLPGAGSPDGRHFYSVNQSNQRLQAYRVDSPTQFTRVQTVAPQVVPGEDVLVVPNIQGTLDIALSPDGRHLFAVTQNGLIVFSRDASTGVLQPGREMLQDNRPDDPFRQMGSLKNVATDPGGTVLFVSGTQTDGSAVADTAIAAFDISTDPSNPAHMHTLTGLFFEHDLDASRARFHLRLARGAFRNCNQLAPHADRPGVDVFCDAGLFVVVWNPATSALEVTDFAIAGEDDRFGTRLPYSLGHGFGGRRQLAQSPDGAHVYRATSVRDREFTDAIHRFERASAMEPAEGDGDSTGSVVTPGTTGYGVDDALPGVPTSGLFVPALLSGGSVSAAGTETTIALDDGGYFELDDRTRYTCTAADGCTIVNATVTAGTVTRRAAGDGELDRFPSFRDAVGPDNQAYTVGIAIDTLTLPEASGGNGTLGYGLSPNVPGLAFNASSRQLSGTPTATGAYAMTYTATDEDGDTDTLGFTITVEVAPDETGSLGDCYVGLTVGIGQSCAYPGTTDQFSVNERGRGSFLGRLAGIRIRFDNETINGRVYDFEASHQGDGVWRIDRVAGSTEPPETPPAGGGTGSRDTSPGEYRLVADMTIGGTRGNYSSENTLVVN